MKTALHLFITILFLSLTQSVTVRGEGFGLGLGLSTPNDAINSVYNTDVLSFDAGLGNLLRDPAKIGYHLSAGYYLSMSEEVYLLFGVSIHRFQETEIDIVHPETDSLLASLATTQNVVPFSAGFGYKLLDEFVGLYLAADLHYNLFFNSVDVIRDNSPGIPISVDDSPSYSRVGASLGTGVTFDLQLFTLDLGLKYNHSNLIGKESEDEDNKTFVTLTAMFIFGNK